MMALKISLALFFLRFITEYWSRRIIYAVTTASTIFSIAYFFYATFQCGVPHGLSFWERRLLGKCAGRSSILGMGYTHAVLTALTDVVFLILMVRVVLKVKVESAEKVVLTGILSLATM